MASIQLTSALNSGRLVVRKARKVSGQVCIVFYNTNIPPVILSSFTPVSLTDIKGMTKEILQKSNLRKLQSLGFIELL